MKAVRLGSIRTTLSLQHCYFRPRHPCPCFNKAEINYVLHQQCCTVCTLYCRLTKTFVFILDCDELYTSEFDRIQLIRYPGIHGKNITCKYQIDVPKPGYSITINFEEFDIQYSSNCRQESVSIFDGQTTSDAMLGIYCGRRRPFYLRSSHNKMLIVFKMNPTPFRKWFQLSYKAGILIIVFSVEAQDYNPITYYYLLAGPHHQIIDRNSKRAERSTSKLGDFYVYLSGIFWQNLSKIF